MLSTRVLIHRFLLTSFWIIPAWGHAQVYPVPASRFIGDIAEIIMERESGDADLETLLEDLQKSSLEPLNLNAADQQELNRIPLLNDFQIYSFIRYRNETGPLLSLNELQYIPGFDKETIALISPFVMIAPPEQSRDLSAIEQKPKQQLFIRYHRVLQEQAGYSQVPDSIWKDKPGSYYEGSPVKLYARYSLKLASGLSANIIAEKDAGETLFRGSNRAGPDFVSGNLVWEGKGRLRQLILGDYHAQFGQGLTLWSGPAYRNATEISSIRYRPRGLKPATSTEENHFLRGLAGSYRLGSWSVSAFASAKKIDANLQQVDTLDEVIFTSTPESGYHRTLTEIENEDALGEYLVGAALNRNGEKLRTGLSFLYQWFNMAPESAEDPWDVAGPARQNSSLGLDYLYAGGKTVLFGEVSINGRGKTGFNQGIIQRINDWLSFSGIYRYYHREFYNYLSNAYGQSSVNQNEHGMYTGIELKPLSGLSFSGYYDLFSYPWFDNRKDPTRGAEYHMQLDYLFSDDLAMYFRFRQNSSWATRGTQTDRIEPCLENRKSLRFQISYRVIERVEFRNRLEWMIFEGEKEEQGFLFYQDLIWRPDKPAVSLAARFALFETPSYKSRIYSYEHDVLYAFSIPAFFYSGSRFYISGKYSPLPWLDLWLKYGHTAYRDRESISSGPSLIAGSVRSEIKLQMRANF